MVKRKNFKKKLCVIGTVCFTAFMVLGSSSAITFAKQATGTFGTSVGKTWPEQVNAPYADMCEWITKDGYHNAGALNLERIVRDTGVKYYNLGFIQSAGGVEGNKVTWGFGGYKLLSEEGGKNDTQYKGIKKSIKDVRDMGGDVCISFGGANGTPFWQTTQDVDKLYNTYMDIVEGFGLTRIDLDVEGSGTSKVNNIANAKAIKKLQDTFDVDVVLTLPVLPDGLTYEGLSILEAYLSQGIDLKAVNIMTMCYGSGTLLPGENYGTASLRAVNSLKDQLKTYYKKYANQTLSDEKAYAKIGTTVSIGYESGSDPVFVPEWSKLVVNQAIEKKIAMTSFWSINRDAMTEPNQGIKKQYEHTSVFSQFGQGGTVNPPIEENIPVLNGIEDKTIIVGSNFDLLEGITASDKKDGDITASIKVDGMVDTKKAGEYKLVYSVTNSEGKVATKTCIITVKEEGNTVEEYDASKIYLKGDIVGYQGKTYECQWWTQGEAPGSQYGPWKLVNR